MIIDLIVVPITMRIKLQKFWLGNPGNKSKYQWTVEATFTDADEALVQSCPNQYGTKSLTWYTEFGFEDWEGSGENEALIRSMSWLARGLQRDATISEGTAATTPYEVSTRRIEWLKDRLTLYPKFVQQAESELEQLQRHGPLRWCRSLIK